MSATDLGNLSPAEKRALLADRLRARHPGRHRFPASFPQQRLWFLERLAPGNAAYNIPSAVRIRGPLDLDAWRRACLEIVRRHEALRIQYADYAVWQRRRLDGRLLAADVEYWKQALADAPPALDLPTDHPRPAVQTTNGGSCPFELSGPVTSDLRALSQREGTTPFMTLLAAFQVLLHRYSRQDALVVGVPVANRRRPEIERLIGFFVNTLPLRTDLSGRPTFRELLGRVRQVCLGAFAHQELPFERLVEELQPPRDLSRSPVFQVSFIFQNIALPEFDVAGLKLEALDVPGSTARFDLELEVFDRPETIAGGFAYNS